MANENQENAQRNEEEEKKKKKWFLLFLLLLLIALISICLCIWAVWFRNPKLTPDYAPKDEDPNASVIEGDDTQEKLDKPEGGGSVSITYIPDVTVDLSEKNVSLMFQNPYRSNSDIVLQLVIQGEIIAQSGKLVPGKQITTMELLSGAANMLSPGGYDGKFVVLFYDPETAERAVLKSEGAVTITVVE